MRLALLLSLSVIHVALGGIIASLYVFIPLLVVLTVSDSTQSFERREGPQLERTLSWLVAAGAYLCFVTDRLPMQGVTEVARMSVRRSAVPSAGRALSRLFTTLPHLVVLCALGVAAEVVGAVAAVAVVTSGNYPLPLWKFQRNVVAWIARVLAYHGGLVEEYPPFSLSVVADDASADGTRPAATPGRIPTS